MGVTRRSEVVYENPSSAQMSSTESLHIGIPSDTEEVEAVTRIPRHNRHLVNRSICRLSFQISPRRFGRRRQRRYESVLALESLLEDSEYEDFLGGFDHPSPFRQLIENPELDDTWNCFLEDDGIISDFTITTNPKKSPEIPYSYLNISSKIRKSLKAMRDLSELKRLEMEVLEHTADSSCGPLERDDYSSYQRLMLHGIAQYYKLLCLSYDGDNGKRKIKLFTAGHEDILNADSLYKIMCQHRIGRTTM